MDDGCNPIPSNEMSMLLKTVSHRERIGLVIMTERVRHIPS